MNSGILLGPDERPISKAEVEAETQRRGYAPGWVGGLFGGPHPMLDQEESAGNWRRDMLEPFIFTDGTHAIDDEHADFSQTIVNTPGAYSDRFVKRNPIADLDTPRDMYGIMNLAMRYAEDHYIVNRAIKVKKNFALREMRIVSKSQSSVAHYEKEFRRLKIRQLLSHIMRYHEIVGRIVVYWGETFPMKGICLLDPRYIIVRRFLTNTDVLLRPHPHWVSAAQRPKSPEYSVLQKTVPSKWMKYIKANEPIPLDENTYALIENDISLFDTRGMSDNTIGGVPLSAAFVPLKISTMLMAGDFSTAWMMKNMYTLISIGDPKMDDYTPPDQTELKKLQGAFQRPEYSLVAYVDPTVNIRFFSPGSDAMDSKRYLHSTQAIEYVLGIPGVFTNGDGSFAAASVSLKPFREDIINMRLNVVDQLFSKLLPMLREGYTAKKTGGQNDPDILFDENCLKDDAVLFAELTGLWDRGAISNRSLLEGRYYDLDMEKQRKEAEKPDKELWQPLFDVAHGDPQPPGGTPTHEGSNGAQNRPSKPK